MLFKEKICSGYRRLKFLISKKFPLFDNKNQMMSIITASFDATENNLFSTEMSSSQLQAENVLDHIIANLPGHVYWKDINGIYKGCNEQQAKSAGLSSRKKMIGLTDYDTPWKAQADALRKIDLKVMETRVPQTAEEISILADGTKAIFLSKKVPLFNKINEVVGILGISFDITGQKQTEEELRETKHKLEGMTLISASIAHELRTPLATISMNANALKSVLPDLVNAYQFIEEKIINRIKESYLNYIIESPSIIEREARSAFTVIDMLLTNLQTKPKITKFQKFRINECIKNALNRYPFRLDQKNLIDWNKNNDFIVEGSIDIMVHLLFNLIKNSLYSIAKAGKGEISIWLENEKNYNFLYFKDTGEGICKENIPFIFDRFFSDTPHGAGIGLTFCKMVMESLGGSIICESVKSEYTLFILRFPTITYRQESNEAN